MDAPTDALFRLTVDPTLGQGPPPVPEALHWGEALHAALVGLALDGRTDLALCPELVGKDAGNRPLAGHGHAHCLPLDLDGDGLLDHALVHCPSGLGANACEAARRLQRLWVEARDVRVELLVLGDAAGARAALPARSERVARQVLPAHPATRWRSVTPWVAPRFIKPRGKNSITGQLALDLESRGFPAPSRVLALPPDEAGVAPWFRHERRRRNGAPPPTTQPWAVELAFESPLSGPLCLGYGSHFGLGLFGAMEQA